MWRSRENRGVSRLGGAKNSEDWSFLLIGTVSVGTVSVRVVLLCLLKEEAGTGRSSDTETSLNLLHAEFASKPRSQTALGVLEFYGIPCFYACPTPAQRERQAV